METVKIGSTEPASTGATSQVTKLIVAVHGIGEQTSYGTIQTVLNQFCAFKGQPAGIPLGKFHGARGLLEVGDPYDKSVFSEYAFSEVYWAKIPRKLVTERYQLEETKAWARTIVERLCLRYRLAVSDAKRHWGDEYAAPPAPDFPLVKEVLSEMILTIGVLDRLTFLVDKAGVFTFDLRRLLDDYLGDVQVVAEWDDKRAEILAEFAKVMNDAVEKFPRLREIHIVAHSEGTVVSFLGLLEAYRQSPLPPWADKVRGLMTLGSPIDKHLLLWPELFAGAPPTAPRASAAERIRWRNYYDFGDPVGFELDATRAWLHDHRWKEVFEFNAAHDHGFSRYALPGKAHVDYWNDGTVFEHFLEEVVGERPAVRTKSPGQPPPSRWLPKLVSVALPFALVAALLVVAAFVMLKATYAAVARGGVDPTGLELLLRSLGLGALLVGMTVVARIPRLTRRWHWRLGTLLVAAASVWAFDRSLEVPGVMANAGFAEDSLTLWLAGIATALVFVVSWLRPRWGIKPLFAIGTAATIVRVASALNGSTGERGPLWPLLLAGAGFIYLWWLAALLLDLATVWHLYIRDFRVRQRFEEITGKRRGKGREMLGRLQRRMRRGRASAQVHAPA